MSQEPPKEGGEGAKAEGEEKVRNLDADRGKILIKDADLPVVLHTDRSQRNQWMKKLNYWRSYRYVYCIS